METTDQGRYSTIELRVRATEAVSRGLPLGQVADAFGVDRTTLILIMSLPERANQSKTVDTVILKFGKLPTD